MCERRAGVQSSGLRLGRGNLVVCQAHPRRVAKVAAQIQREISEMFIYDSVLADAISPERKTGFDPALTAIASITYVYVSNDLQVVKAYVSIYSDDAGKRRAMANLKRLQPYVRAQIGRRVRLRLTPDVRFEYDDSIEEAELIQRVMGPDFERYQREAEAEALGITPEELAAREAAAAAGGAGVGEEEEEEGLFDEVAEDDEDADADEGEWWEEPASEFLRHPGPFDDLFVGGAPGPLLQVPRERPRRQWPREQQPQRQQPRGQRGDRGGRGRDSGVHSSGSQRT